MDYVFSEWAQVQMREHQLLQDVARHANRGDVLRLALESRLGESVQGTFVGFTEQKGTVYIELHTGSVRPAWVDPVDVTIMQVIRAGIAGFSKDYRSREGQGAPRGGPSI